MDSGFAALRRPGMTTYRTTTTGVPTPTRA
jgi:hypothetical protein